MRAWKQTGERRFRPLIPVERLPSPLVHALMDAPQSNRSVHEMMKRTPSEAERHLILAPYRLTKQSNPPPKDLRH